MKKGLILAVLVAAMVFAFVPSAFATWGGWTPTSPYATAGGAPRPASSYVLWDDAPDKGSNVPTQTPHKGYTTSSTQCAVCHSVHYAPVFSGEFESTSTGAYLGTTNANYAAGVAAGSTQAQMLLRSNVGNACNYCHINTSIGVKEVYAGDPDIFGYSQNFTSSFAHNYHDAGCADCHSTHGSQTYEGPLASKILHRLPRNRAPQREVVTATSPSTPSSSGPVPALFATAADAYAGTDIAGTGDRWVQETAFCSSCHYVYSDKSEAAIQERGGTARWHKQHPMKGADAAATAAGASGTNNNKQWAWVGSGTCRSCHSAGVVDEVGAPTQTTGYSTANYPHYTQDKYRFLEQSSSAEHATDQVCLDCHRNSGGTAGVGISF